MTLFLASVTELREAKIVSDLGADILDLIDLSERAVPIQILSDLIAANAGQRLISICAGTSGTDLQELLQNVQLYSDLGADIIKVGFLNDEKTGDYIQALKAQSLSHKLIAVLYADRHPDFDLIPAFAEAGFKGVMVDVWDKNRSRLLYHLPPHLIRDFVERSKSLGLIAGLAGVLEAPDVPRLLPYQPDFLGFRSALCEGGIRSGTLDSAAIQSIRALVSATRSPHFSDEEKPIQTTLASAADLGTDKIFVRDFILPVEIGAYQHEYGHSQKVRFDVIAEVRRVTADPQELQDIVSYDIIMDGIREIVARGHVVLAEALAEAVAQHVLAQRQVVKVKVRVEKLEVAPARVGVEIERSRFY